MRAPVEWLSQYCGGVLSTAELEERLTMTGTKNVGSRLNGRWSSACMDAGSESPVRAAVAMTKRISIRPRIFHAV